MAGTKELRTNRLLLRRYTAEDAAPLHEGFGIDSAMSEYSGWNPYATLEMARKTLADAVANYTDPHFYGWAIEYETRLIGTIGAYDYDKERNTVEVGMSIEKPSWGKGFATEALSDVLRYLTEEEGIAIVIAWCASDNIGSWHALEKAGMVKVKVEKDALTIGDATYNKLWYEYGGEGTDKDV